MHASTITTLIQTLPTKRNGRSVWHSKKKILCMQCEFSLLYSLVFFPACTPLRKGTHQSSDNIADCICHIACTLFEFVLFFFSLRSLEKLWPNGEKKISTNERNYACMHADGRAAAAVLMYCKTLFERVTQYRNNSVNALTFPANTHMHRKCDVLLLLPMVDVIIIHRHDEFGTSECERG